MKRWIATLRDHVAPYALLALAAPCAAWAQTPYSGTPVALPATWEAENFDRGGEGVAYHDTTPGNSGGQYRTGEDVDLFVSNDAAGGGYIVKNFEAGEWLGYTVSVPASGNYDIDVRAVTNAAFPGSAYHIEVDGVNVSGSIALPTTDTVGWSAYQWVGKKTVALSAGTRFLKIVADKPYFGFNSIRVLTSAAPVAGPYSGGPIALPGAFEAENFDKGGEGVGYHDNTKGNAGGQYRNDVDVDIIASPDASGGGYVVNDFATGEWLAYTVNVASAAKYNIELRASSTLAGSAFHVEIDGRDVTGPVSVPNTGNWSAFQWVGPKGVALAAGRHALKIVANQQYFNLNSVRVTPTPVAAPYSGSPAPVPGVLEAENFDRGGEGVAYHDTTPGNDGGQYRTGEDVDIAVSNDAAGGGYIVKNFEAGEWLGYTVSVPASGKYDIDVRAVTNAGFPGSAYHIEVDGVNVSGSIVLPTTDTAGWSAYQWVGRKTVALSAGTRFLKIVADKPYFALNAIQVSATPANLPYGGAPAAVPGIIEAENFDLGGQGAAYNDTTPGNDGGQYRTGEDVDIAVSNDAAGGGYIVKNFEAGEWLGYTISVPASGNYDIDVRAVTNAAFPGSAYHIEVDGVNVSGSLVLPTTDTVGWSAYQWVGKKTVALSAGTRFLKIVADKPYFGLNSIRVSATPVAPPPPDPSQITFLCNFPSSPNNCGFFEQAMVAGRASIVGFGRNGSTAVRLHTEPGDDNVAGSGTNERNDLSLSQSATGCYEGAEQWWGHSILFPDDFVDPPESTASTWNWTVVADFHNSNPGAGQANFMLLVWPKTAIASDRPTGLGFQIAYGDQFNSTTQRFPIGPLVKNVWYDFVYHVKWSSGTDGFFIAWVNGVKKMDHRGPTIYAGQGCYLKLANYHPAYGQPNSVIQSRVVRGTTPGAVSLTPLEGILP